jgi:hypothetical protein
VVGVLTIVAYWCYKGPGKGELRRQRQTSVVVGCLRGMQMEAGKGTTCVVQRSVAPCRQVTRATTTSECVIEASECAVRRADGGRKAARYCCWGSAEEGTSRGAKMEVQVQCTGAAVLSCSLV